jgi:hypothetical protein
MRTIETTWWTFSKAHGIKLKSLSGGHTWTMRNNMRNKFDPKMWDKIKVHMEKNNPEHHWENSLEILGILLGNRTSKPKQFSKFLLTPHWTPRVPTLERKKERKTWACSTNVISCLPNIFLHVFNTHFCPDQIPCLLILSTFSAHVSPTFLLDFICDILVGSCWRKVGEHLLVKGLH